MNLDSASNKAFERPVTYYAAARGQRAVQFAPACCRSRPLRFTVRLRMTRTANAIAPLALLISSQVLGASNCSDPDQGDLVTWVRSMIREAHYVLVGRLSAVMSRDADFSTQVAVLEVQTPLKGSPNFSRLGNTGSGPNLYSMVGEARVFFIDAHRSIVECSNYPSDTTELVLREVERALRGSAT